jgi:uncharacterized protein DUF2760
MDDERSLGFFARFGLAFVLFWKMLLDGSLAARLATAQRLPAAPVEAVLPPRPAQAPPPPARDTSAALHLLAILQREGRFVDFLQEDITSLPDAQVGAAARVVQEGCKKGLGQYLDLEPVRTEEEGAPVTVESGFDAGRIRLTGNVVGQPPFRGRLAHHGWHARQVRLPTPPDGQDPSIIAPAEVEV